MKKTLTLCVVAIDSRVLLGMKKRGFGTGRWNGFGGKVEEGETIEEAAIRETKEEVGITPIKMEKVGILEFSFRDNDEELEAHVFHVEEIRGEPVETEEMYPEWFEYENIPFGQMWTGDELWLPFLLTRKLFRGRIRYDKPVTIEEGNEVLDYNIDVVDSL
jgi:mutator protein MutT